MRIVAGEWGGRLLQAPRSGVRGGVRPTQDRVRQILFDILADSITEGPVCDLYAGSGALGLEALSRGAPRAVLVEADRGVRQVLHRNCSALAAGDRARVLGMTVARALALLSAEGITFRWILADPPYDNPEVLDLLATLGAPDCPLLREGAGLALECRVSTSLAERAGLLLRRRTRVVGETALHFYVRVGAAPAAGSSAAGGDGQDRGTNETVDNEAVDGGAD